MTFHSTPLPTRSARKPGADPVSVLREVFRHSGFRNAQADAVAATLAGRDSLVVMPTSAGKSICYQVPALCLPGLTVVVSPLLALMRDQADGLRARGVRAAALVSERAQPPEERALIETAVASGTIDILYVSPERLLSRRFSDLALRLDVSLIAIDEAHCVCDWGRDFRPDYLALPGAAEAMFPRAVRTALTATASVRARDDIAARLLRPDAVRFVAAFGRPNISLASSAARDPMGECAEEASRASGARIVYCRSRTEADAVAAAMNIDGRAAARPYHAGLGDGERGDAQQAFLSNEIDAIAATSAFGMGIDKPDVSLVLHAGLPSSLEAYYQESGRAGRDGRPAKARVFWSARDVGRRTALAASLEPEARAREYARLAQVLSYVESPTCRMNVLLRRFGERPANPCGNCDACLSPTPLRPGAHEAKAARAILTRLGDAGLSLVGEVLAGASTERVEREGLAMMPEFGSMRSHGVVGAKRILRQLVAQGILLVDDETARLKVDDEAAIEDVVLFEERLRPTRVPLLEGIPERRLAAWRGLLKARSQYAVQTGRPPLAIASDADLARLVAGGVPPLEKGFMDRASAILAETPAPLAPASMDTGFVF